MSSGEVLLPREAARFITKHAKDVSILNEGVSNLVTHLLKRLREQEPVLFLKGWRTHELNVKTSDKAGLDWVFLADVGNFSFWSDDESRKYEVVYKGKTYTGYWSWCAAINRALDEGIAFTDPAYYRDLTLEQLKHLLRSDSQQEMPMLEERLQVLQEAGKVLCEKYDGSYLNMLRQCNHSAQKLLQMLTQDIPSFRDTAELEGQKVALYKRAQILIADTWSCCQGEGYGRFDDIDTITMFADYRIPQALVWMGALKYSDDLMEELKSGRMYVSGERREVEIRGCSIQAVEDVVSGMNAAIQADGSFPPCTSVNAILVDHYLWDYRRDHAAETRDVPFHRIRCIYY